MTCLLSLPLYSQNSPSDSLFFLLKQARKKSSGNHKLQLNLLHQIGEQLLKEGSNDALKYIRQALVLSNKTNYKVDKLRSLIMFGLYYQHNHYPQKAIEYFNEALKAAKKEKFHARAAEISTHLGQCYRSFNEIQTSIYHYFEAASFYRKVPDNKGYIKAINSIAGAFYDIGEYRKSLTYFRQTMESAEKINDPYELMIALNNVGSTYNELGSYAKALEYLKRGLKLTQKNQGKPRITGALLSSIGEVYLKQKDYDISLKYFNQAWDIAQEIKYPHLLVIVGRDLAKTHAAKQDYQQALSYGLSSLKTSQEMKDVHQQQLNYALLATIYKQSKDFEQALFYYDKYHQLNDSSQHNAQTEAMRRLELKHQNAQKEQDIKLLIKEKEIQKARFQQKQNTIYLSIIIFLVLLIPALMLYRYYRNKKHTRILFEERNKIIALQNEKIQSQTYHLQRKNEELNTKNEALTELNDEKNLLVSALAHDLRSPLNQVKGLLQLTQLSIAPEDETTNYLQKALQSTDRLRDMIDRILDLKVLEEKQLNLQLENLDLHDLLTEVTQSFADIAQKKSIDLVVPPAQLEQSFRAYLDKNYTLQVFENLVSNAIKFSPPHTQIAIDIGWHQNKVRVTVKDQGPGISSEDQEKLFEKFQKLSARPTGGETSVGLGLSIVKKFVEAMQGKVWCESVPNKGCSFIVEFERAVD
jgi:signal transduction histidine kinase/tetratricopeptide (TPR) repeat protein